MPRKTLSSQLPQFEGLFDEGMINPAPKYKEEDIRSASLKGKVALAVSRTLKDDGRSRDEIAQAMSTWLGEKVSKSMLDAYASHARSQYKLTPDRMWALIEVTKDIRLLREIAESVGYVVMESWASEWIELACLEERNKRDASRIAELRRRRLAYD